jgi:hypothetical protein
MDENKEIPKPLSRIKMILNLAMIALAVLTIALLLYMLSLYLPLKEQCLKCLCNNTNVNLTDFVNR